MNSKKKHRILILGSSGFIGNALYKELCSYYKTFGSYARYKSTYDNNKHLFHYNHEQDDIYEILEILKPTVIISAMRGDFGAQLMAHKHIIEYVEKHKCRILFLSSANVFDGYSKFPSYEYDTPLSNSIYGHFKIKMEQLIRSLPEHKWIIARLPMVFGLNSPRLEEIKEHLANNTNIEVFPNLIMNVASDQKITQQIHYLINRNKSGLYHLGSNDLVHHDEFIKKIIAQLGSYNPVYKQVYTTNGDRYLAVLPRDNKLPKQLQAQSTQVLEDLKV